MYRNEFWYILEGDIMIELEFADPRIYILQPTIRLQYPKKYGIKRQISAKTSTYIRSAIWR